MEDERFCIDVGGVYYVSTLQTLRKSSTLKHILAKYADNEDVVPFIDRDAGAFHYILNFLRNGSVQYIDDRSFVEFLIVEAGYYGLRKMESQLSKMLTERRTEFADLTIEVRNLRSALKTLSESPRTSLSRPSSTNHNHS